MSTEARVRKAIDNSLKALREQHSAELDRLVKTFVDSAVEVSRTDVAQTRAQTERAAQERLEQSLSQARSEADAALANAMKRAREEAEDARAKLAQDAQRQLQQSLTQAQAESDAALATAMTRAHAEAERVLASALRKTRAEADRAGATLVENARAAERETYLSRLSRLCEGIKTLDGATSLSEVLNILVEYTSQEAGRVAVMVVRGDRLQGWQLVGFGDRAPDPQSVELKRDGVGVIVEALRSKDARTSGPELSGFGFAPLPTGHTGLAVPVEVDGKVVAVLYADDATNTLSDGPNAWTDAVEALVRHSAQCLYRLMAVHVGAA